MHIRPYNRMWREEAPANVPHSVESSYTHWTGLESFCNYHKWKFQTFPLHCMCFDEISKYTFKRVMAWVGPASWPHRTLRHCSFVINLTAGGLHAGKGSRERGIRRRPTRQQRWRRELRCGRRKYYAHLVLQAVVFLVLDYSLPRSPLPLPACRLPAVKNEQDL